MIQQYFFENKGTFHDMPGIKMSSNYPRVHGSAFDDGVNGTSWLSGQIFNLPVGEQIEKLFLNLRSSSGSGIVSGVQDY